MPGIFARREASKEPCFLTTARYAMLTVGT
jgi:hypothetical protein